MSMSRTSTTVRSNETEPTTDRLTTMAHETIDQVSSTANRAAQEVRGAAARTVESAKQAQERAIAAADENLNKVRSYVEHNPLAAVGIAVAVGALLISLIRR
jgi:ElaB/YqjD/DUF883 family membrane-anchored ribosome-binding protein